MKVIPPSNPDLLQDPRLQVKCRDPIRKSYLHPQLKDIDILDCHFSLKGGPIVTYLQYIQLVSVAAANSSFFP